MPYYFPFGQEVCAVEQQDKSPKKVFVLGADAGAVYAKWEKDGQIICQSIAVASEPNIYWDGNLDEAKQIIDAISIPSEAGVLTPSSEQLDGACAKVLCDNILKPLGLTFNDVWLCNCMPEARLTPNQLKIVNEIYNPLVAQYGLNKASVPARPFILCDSARSEQITYELVQSHADTLILLGDTPISQYLKKVADISYSTLGEYYRLYGYGVTTDVTIGGKNFKILPLVHPRQIGALGTCNKRWFNIHKEWEDAK
ncbi:MAG: hypothetical protein IJC83_02335 [Oscillospiraceae bacterium]|nr:hypothetical protein [Oscillospiraceae bacterium]